MTSASVAVTPLACNGITATVDILWTVCAGDGFANRQTTRSHGSHLGSEPT